MLTLASKPDLILHPLDEAEEWLHQHDMPHDRPAEDELIADIAGQWCNLALWYRWEEPLGVFVFSCALDVKVSAPQRAKTHELLIAMNQKMWLGHFDLIEEDGTVLFRYSLLLREGEPVAPDMLDNLLEIATTECNRLYPALQSVLWGGKNVADAIEIALFDTCGEA